MVTQTQMVQLTFFPFETHGIWDFNMWNILDVPCAMDHMLASKVPCAMDHMLASKVPCAMDHMLASKVPCAMDHSASQQGAMCHGSQC